MFAYEKQRTFNICCRASSKNDKRLRQGLQKSIVQIETTLQVVNSIAVGLECRLIPKLGWPDLGIAWMNHIPANSSFADAALQIRNVCGLLQTLQLMQLRLIGRLSESLARSLPHLKPGSKRRPFAQSTQDKKLVLKRILRDCVSRRLAPDVMRTLN